MADRLKGITLEIGGDTTKLSKALSGVNSDINSTKRQLKDVERLLKLDPTNVELLRQKEQLLNREIGSTKDKVEQLKQVQQTMDATGVDKTSEQYMALQREIISTETDLKNLETATRNFGSVAAQELAAVGKEVEAVGGKISAAGDKISGLGRKLLPVTGAVIGLGGTAVKFSSDIEESENKVEVVFGDASDRVMAFADTTLDAYGIARGTALDMASLFGDMATSMDLPVDTAAAMSEQLVGLSGDLASFKNVGVDQAAQALTGIFTGETESLKSLGVVMTQNALLQYAKEKGMIDTSKSFLQQQKEALACEKAYDAWNKAIKEHGYASLEAREAALKYEEACAKQEESAKASLDTLSQDEMVMLRYSYVMDKTQNAQGDFARTSDGTANSMRVMQESTKEAVAAFGELLLPIITPIIQKITEIIKYITGLDESQKKTILTILGIVAAVGPVLTIIGKTVSAIGKITSGVGILMEKLPKLQSAFSSVFGFIAAHPVFAIILGLILLFATFGDEIQEVLQKIDDCLQGIFLKDFSEIFGPVVGEILNTFLANVKNVWDSFKKMLDGVIDVIRGVFTLDWERAWTGVKEIFSALFDGLLAIAEVPLNGIIGLLNMIIDSANWCIEKLNKIPGVNFDTIGKLPFLASGGTVYNGSAVVGDAGPEILTVTGGHAVVTPLTGSQRAAGAAAAAGGAAFRTEVGITFGGSLSQLAAVLQPCIVAETHRLGGSFTED